MFGKTGSNACIWLAVVGCLTWQAGQATLGADPLRGPAAVQAASRAPEATRPVGYYVVPAQPVFFQGPPSYGHPPQGPPTVTPTPETACVHNGGPAGACPTCRMGSQAGGALSWLDPRARSGWLCPNGNCRFCRSGTLCRNGLGRLFGCDGCPKLWYPTHHHTYCYKRPQGLVYPPQNQPAAVVQYPYYTVKGPTDFFYDE
ncbi:MAG TPA: hypothetical protein EYP14_09175 [Planctomycetaceae bacterium]|nr:hypothetical protein [Planctomycetaceae bacterium]